MISFDELRIANECRQREWDPNDQITGTFRGNETAGELGEALEQAVGLLMMSITMGRAANIIKKLEREAMGLRGSRATKEDLAKELADLVICADLIAMKYNIELGVEVREKFNNTSRERGLSVFI